MNHKAMRNHRANVFIDINASERKLVLHYNKEKRKQNKGQ